MNRGPAPKIAVRRKNDTYESDTRNPMMEAEEVEL